MKKQFNYKPLKERTTNHLVTIMKSRQYFEPNFVKAVARELHKRRRK